MSSTVRSEDVLRRAPGCVVRAQVDQVLLYNPRTDELHLVSHKAYAAVGLCDGVTTVGDIEEWIGGSRADAASAPSDSPTSAELRAAVRTFLSALVERGLLEIDDA